MIALHESKRNLAKWDATRMPVDRKAVSVHIKTRSALLRECLAAS